MKRLHYVIVVILCLNLVGCSTTSVKTVKDKTEEYNQTIKTTLHEYKKGRNFAEENKDVILLLVKEDRLENFNIVLDSLTEEEREDFNNYFSVVSDDYFLCTSDNRVREVITIVGGKYMMTLDILWSNTGVDEIDRVVKLK